MQAQEALKIINGMPVQAGKVMHFNGMTNEMHTTAYQPREDCESHWIYGDVVEIPARASQTTLGELLSIARQDLGEGAVIELDQEIILSLECFQCKTHEPVLKPISAVSFQGAHCPVCGVLRDIQMTHMITGEESFLHLTLSSVGVPSLHIIRAFNGSEYRFYELTGDMPEALHFSHFEKTSIEAFIPPDTKIRLGEEVPSNDPEPTSPKTRVVFLDE
jgi:hypothetical protein